MTEPVRRLLVAYDIAEDRRREQIAHLLESYGDRVQYSVFIVDGRPAAFIRMRRRLESLVDFSPTRSSSATLGRSPLSTPTALRPSAGLAL